MTLKFYIKKEEDSLYFEHFFKVVYNKARKIGGLWIKLRKLKILSIAHRLTTLKNCDNIIVMDHGQVVQSGKYDTLINQEGIFSDMYYGKLK